MRLVSRSWLATRVALGAVFAFGCGSHFNGCKGERCTGGTAGSGASADEKGNSTTGSGGDASPSATDETQSGGSAESGGSGGGSGASGGRGGKGAAADTVGAAGSGVETLGGAGAAGAGGDGPDCDDTASPFEDACVVSEDYGVFVSPLGNDDSGDGSRENPLRTLATGMLQAKSEGKRVYACATEGAYDENVSINSKLDSIELFGSFDCDGWRVDEGLVTRVAPSDGIALVVAELVDGLLIDGFAFESGDAEAPGESSIAAFVRDSENVTLRRSTFSAGDGADGADGATENVVFPSTSVLDGKSGTANAGGAPVVVACPVGGTTVGGAGGSTAPTAGEPGLPDYGVAGGQPGVVGQGCQEGAGDRGADAPPASPGPGATVFGRVDAGGWLPEAGAAGEPGRPGQGGGGGAGTANHGGASGAAGTCGGAGGAPGLGGGASIGLLLLDSHVTLVQSLVATRTAGDGGAGDAGQLGQPGSPMGGLATGDGCSGATGGLGADGGPGGGGAGGVSIGIVVSGEAPELTHTVITLGEAGVGGVGGDPSDPGNNHGIDGVSDEVLVL